jgi:hypothetical protein
MCASLSGCHGDDVSGISGNSDEYAAMEIGVHGFRKGLNKLLRDTLAPEKQLEAA